MPRAYSLDLRQRLIDAVEAGSSARSAARRLQVSASTAVKWVQRKRETGSVEAKPIHGRARNLIGLTDKKLAALDDSSSQQAFIDHQRAHLRHAHRSLRFAFRPKTQICSLFPHL